MEEEITQTPSENEAKEQITEQQPANKKRRAGEVIANYFTATRVAYMAVFTALSFILRMPLFEFPIIPAVPYLKIDFSGVFALIAGFSLGPVAGIIVSVLKEVLYGLSFTQTFGVGEVANILIMLPYILIPSIVYKKHKGIKTVLITVSIGCVAQTIFSIPVNYLLTFPFFLNVSYGMSWTDGMQAYLGVWYWALLFNFVKCVLLTVAVFILYKSISRLIKITNEKFTKRNKR
ncbi:MAG: ECF transporter S component [Clostridia bacterium]|nr:ECF transporter S component [Clostridia bacterium]